MNLRDLFSIHRWWGRIIGAIFGYMMARSVGAIIGIIIGNLFDQGLSRHFSRPHMSYHAENREAVQKAFFRATFLVLGHVAKSDGRVTVNELKMAKGIMEEMRLSNAQKEQAKQLFNQGKQPDFNLGNVLTNLKMTCHDNHDLLRLFIDIQYRAAQIDGINQAKVRSLDAIFQSLGFAPLHRQYRFYQDFDTSYEESRHQQRQQHRQHYQHQGSSYSQQRARTSSPIEQAYAILEVPKTASKQEVKRAYRKLMSRNHPDKLIAQGLPEEMIKIATDKTQAIAKAYEEICQFRGW